MATFWHPFAKMGKVSGDELVLVRGDGCSVWDAQGREFIDASAGLWYCNVGHGREEIADAIQAQASSLASCSSFDRVCSDRALELTERIAGIAPVEEPAVFLTSGGSDAVDTAAKLARQYWFEVGKPEKTVIISREGSYHGTHAYGTSLAGIEANRSGFGELISDVARVPKLSAQALADEIDRAGADRVAAFFAEPMINSGVWAPNDGYLTQVAEICRDRDVLFIADEVVTGFGRLGVNFASERYGIEPDMILFAKGCTSGYLPLGGVIVAKRVRELFWRPDTDVSFRHGYTYSGHATACAAAMANLDILEREELPRRVAEAEADFAAACEVLSDLPEVSEIRAVGFAAAVQLDQAHIERDPDLPRLATAAALEHGVLVRMLSSFSFQISPPLIIDNEEIERIVQGIADGLISLRSDSFRP